MKKAMLILLLIVAVVVIAAFFVFKKDHTRVCFKNTCFEVEIANNFASRELGLMFRKSLGQNKGMLFVFGKEGTYPFWMKNTLIPLDIIWINSNNEVVYISENTRPCKESCPLIDPQKGAKYVLEINAGLSKGLSIGDKVEIKK